MGLKFGVGKRSENRIRLVAELPEVSVEGSVGDWHKYASSSQWNIVGYTGPPRQMGKYGKYKALSPFYPSAKASALERMQVKIEA